MAPGAAPVPPLEAEEIPADAFPDDVVLLLTAAAAQANDEVLRLLGAAGYADLRFNDGFVFQHLVPGPVPIGDLAPKLGVTQQAASKAVTDLERRGYVARVPHPDDGRVRLVALTERGRGAVTAGRRARATVARRLRRALGERADAQFVRQLRAATEELGGVEAMRRRRLRPS